MKLRNRLNVISTTSVAMALIVSGAIYWASEAISTSSKRVSYGHEIMEIVSDLEAGLRGIMSFNRAMDQTKWHSAQAKMSHKLISPPALTTEQKTLIKSINASSKSLSVLFAYLIEIKPDTGIKINQGLRKHLADRLYVQMDTIVENSYRLTLIAQDDINNTVNVATAGIVVLLFILAATMSLFALHLGRYISEAVNSLGNGLKQVTEGSLDTHVEIDGDDEISQLALDFNHMTKRLMETTVARDRLQLEANARSQELNYLAHHDPLTGLPNRLLFDALLEQSLNHAKRNNEGVAVVFLDLDRFKNINDSLGHPVGDELLQCLADRFKNTLREMDTVARISGDEFIVLIEEVEKVEDAEHAIKKLVAIFDEPFLLQGYEIRVTASMGVSLFPVDGEEPSALIKNADAAMYLAKDEGRNSFKFYNDELTKNAFDQVFLETALRGALSRNEFYLEYQPQVNIESHRIIGMEALLRWNHPELGLISPTIFIPIAEANGLIHDIGAWVLSEACKQGKVWLDSKLNFGRIAVNIAGPQIMKTGFSKLVSNVLSVSRFPPENLELEVTEGSIMQNTERAIQQLRELRSMGIELAIDDFGTGYSSLSYLKKLPVHRLKIDRSFIIDIPEDEDDMVIAEAVIALGEALGLVVIAEGVENEEQLSFLTARGCSVAQGFLFSRAINAEYMTDYLHNEKQIAGHTSNKLAQ